ncbi:Holliday junction branch migration DNA helicase RuvB [Pseudomonas serbica]|jgi:Holliday junction DNA helicase RuvB|uniref:Holliday junction branch migration DNA helicase RuvB n=1 Tax=Pseudomonas serbica TaxID=2965074 RepID=UPI00237B602A|nr:Holliday junction branch migration DNA helicase RuvB [Pseudomonas serbica]
MTTDVVEDVYLQDKALRPLTLNRFAGQPVIVEQLEIFIEAAKKRGETLDHVLLSGPPGLGKTTLANIIANEMEGPFTSTSGPLLQDATALAPLLVSLEPGAVLFIDEIHRIPIQVEEILYSAMEDGMLDVMVGEVEKKTLRIQLSPFTLIGATTRSGNLSAPLRDRFGMTFRFEYYQLADLTTVVSNAAEKLGMDVSRASAELIARRSRGTPRIALRLLRRVRDVLETKNYSGQDIEHITLALELLRINDKGLSTQDLNYLRALVDAFSGGPVGLNTLSAALSEDSGTLEDTVEPYLLQEGYIQRTPRGRMATPLAASLLGLPGTVVTK